MEFNYNADETNRYLKLHFEHCAPGSSRVAPLAKTFLGFPIVDSNQSSSCLFSEYIVEPWLGRSMKMKDNK